MPTSESTAKPGSQPKTSPSEKMASAISKTVGKPVAFISAAVVVFAWLCSGPAFQFNDTWQLIINTTTSVITFLMVFIIQNAQNRDSIALNLKMDELLLLHKSTNKDLINIEDASQDELENLKQTFDNKVN
jgi:low affinity Fe/Cu permease